MDRQCDRPASGRCRRHSRSGGSHRTVCNPGAVQGRERLERTSEAAPEVQQHKARHVRRTALRMVRASATVGVCHAMSHVHHSAFASWC